MSILTLPDISVTRPLAIDQSIAGPSGPDTIRQQRRLLDLHRGAPGGEEELALPAHDDRFGMEPVLGHVVGIDDQGGHAIDVVPDGIVRHRAHARGLIGDHRPGRKAIALLVVAVARRLVQAHVDAAEETTATSPPYDVRLQVDRFPRYGVRVGRCRCPLDNAGWYQETGVGEDGEEIDDDGDQDEEQEMHGFQVEWNEWVG